MTTPPLHRHPALQPLSREHFNGLVQARRLVQAAEAEENERRRRVRDFAAAWASEISPHFDDEERLLSSLVAAEDAARLFAEHRQIRTLVDELLSGDARPDPDRLRLLGRLLHDHIRWEERSLFPAVQAAASEDEMRRIAEHTSEVEAQRPGSRRRNSGGPDARAGGGPR